jgi:hypothetical protein
MQLQASLVATSTTIERIVPRTPWMMSMPDQPTSRIGPRAAHLAQARCRDIRPGPRGTTGKFHPLDNPVDVHSSTGCRIVKPVFDRDLVRTVAGRLQPIATGRKRPVAVSRVIT